MPHKLCKEALKNKLTAKLENIIIFIVVLDAVPTD
jgi:hypothetical protein